MHYSSAGSSVSWNSSRPEILGAVAIPFPPGSSQTPGLNPVPAPAGRFFYRLSPDVLRRLHFSNQKTSHPSPFSFDSFMSYASKASPSAKVLLTLNMSSIPSPVMSQFAFLSVRVSLWNCGNFKFLLQLFMSSPFHFILSLPKMETDLVKSTILRTGERKKRRK